MKNKISKMKLDRSITFTIVLFVIILFSTIQIIGQETTIDSKKKQAARNIQDPGTPQAFGDTFEFKNDEDNSILTITDEGNDAGSITLPSVGGALSGNKLYNNGGSLYWGNSTLGTSSGNDNDWEVSTFSPITRLSNENHSVGIGTPTGYIEAKLHLIGDNGVLFEGTYGSGTSVNLGAGARFHFYPKKAALRSGRVSGNQWDDANIGTNSTAFGSSTSASGDAAISVGFESQANGNSSIALGFRNISTGNRSMAIGSETNAKTFASFAIGRFNAGTGSATSWIASDPLFEIGNGSSSGSLSNALTVLKNGNVGIGLIDPSIRFQIRGLTGENPFSVQINTSDKLKVFQNGGTSIGTSANPPANGLFVSGEIKANNINSTGANLILNNNLTVKSTNVGIGTTTPTEKLEVDGTAKITGVTKLNSLEVGSNGSLIKEIVKIEGTTTSEDRTSILYPSGFNENNTHILSLKVRYQFDGTLYDYYLYSKDDGINFNSIFIIIGHNDQNYRNSEFQLILMRID